MKIDTRFIISAICIIVSVAISYAQKMAIASFKMDDEDQTTNV